MLILFNILISVNIMCELFRGFYIGNENILKNPNFIRETKIKRILNGHKLFETEEPLEINYNNLEIVNNFINKSINILLKSHCLDSESCILVCKDGNRISLLIAIFYLSKICNIDKCRAFEIIKSKYDIKYDKNILERFL